MKTIFRDVRYPLGVLFDDEEAAFFEFEPKDYSLLEGKVVCRVNDTQECADTFDQVLQSFCEAKIDVDVVKVSRDSSKSISSDFHNLSGKHQSIFAKFNELCLSRNKNCTFSIIESGNRQIESLIQHAKKVKADHIYDLPELANDGIKVSGTTVTAQK